MEIRQVNGCFQIFPSQADQHAHFENPMHFYCRKIKEGYQPKTAMQMAKQKEFPKKETRHKEV